MYFFGESFSRLGNCVRLLRKGAIERSQLGIPFGPITEHKSRNYEISCRSLIYFKLL
jgi:hypothetical protein